MRIKINNTTINNIRYADDTVFISSDINTLHFLLDRVVVSCNRFCHKINTNGAKTAVSTQPTTAVILKVGPNPLDNVKKIKYLGELLSGD